MAPNVDARPVINGKVGGDDAHQSQDDLVDEKRPQQTGAVADDAPEQPERREQDAAQEKQGDDGEAKKDGPAGGYDSIPIPSRPPGYTIKFTIHRAKNLPMADINSLSSDPYVIAEIKSDTPTRHKEDPRPTLRTPTIRRSTDPEWNTTWIVANVPSSGFKLKLRVYDEDPADKDDRLGNVHIEVPSLSEGWQGIHDKGYDIEKRSGSKRAYAIRAVATCFRVAKHMHGCLYVSVEMVGRTPEDGQNGRLYTIGPQWWTRHYSPLLGRLANVQDPGKEKGGEPEFEEGQQTGTKKREAKRYDFQANQMQLRGERNRTTSPIFSC